MVGVACLTCECDLHDLCASAPELDSCVREWNDQLGIQRRRRRGCRAGRLVRLRRDTKPRVRQPGIPRYRRGHRAGKTVSRHASLRPVGNGAYVISANHPPARRCTVRD